MSRMTANRHTYKYCGRCVTHFATISRLRGEIALLESIINMADRPFVYDSTVIEGMRILAVEYADYFQLKWAVDDWLCLVGGSSDYFECVRTICFTTQIDAMHFECTMRNQYALQLRKRAAKWHADLTEIAQAWC